MAFHLLTTLRNCAERGKESLMRRMTTVAAGLVAAFLGCERPPDPPTHEPADSVVKTTTHRLIAGKFEGADDSTAIIEDRQGHRWLAPLDDHGALRVALPVGHSVKLSLAVRGPTGRLKTFAH